MNKQIFDCTERLNELTLVFDKVKDLETTEYFQYELKSLKQVIINAENLVGMMIPPTKFKVGDKVSSKLNPNLKGQVFGSVHLVPTRSISTRSWQVLIRWTNGIADSMNIMDIEKQTEGEVDGS